MFTYYPILAAAPPASLIAGGEPLGPAPVYKAANVTNGLLSDLAHKIGAAREVSFDTETTGLYPFKSDKMFAAVFGIDDTAYYIDTRDYQTPEQRVNLASFLAAVLGAPEITLYGFNIKFDLHFVRKYVKTWTTLDPHVECKVVDVKSLCRLENNSHMNYSLADCAEREGLQKDDTVEQYIAEHKCYSYIEVPGKQVRQKIPHFDQVPRELMFKYASIDAIITYKLAKKKLAQLEEMDTERRYQGVLDNESELIKNVLLMEHSGLSIDKTFVGNACAYEYGRELKAKEDFKEITGESYLASPKLFAKIFESEKSSWKFTEKGNPSFDYDTLSVLTHPAAKAVLTMRDAKSRQDFYNGFVYYADGLHRIHPNLDPSGTATGRFSSSQPNFQNLTNEEEDTKEGYLIRRAIVPRHEGNVLVSIDYSQQEYRLMLDYAGEMDLIDAIMGGADVHQATADMMGVSRREAKTLNFMLLYGGGAQKLADTLKIELSAAKELKSLYFSRLPRVRRFIELATETARQRGYVFNWLGRRLQFPDKEFAYKAPNALIQGGGADIMKVAINKVCKYLDDNKVNGLFPVLTVHDELVLEGHRLVAAKHVGEIKSIMEKAYPHKNIPMACSVAWSAKSLAEPDMQVGAL